MYSVLKRLLIGSPLASEALGEQRLHKRVALAVFGTDAIASTAFASQEILVVLVPVAGMAALDYLVPISLVVIALLAIVTASYRQTLYAYPSGGGSYIVSRENLGTGTSLVAAAALMVDYTLTVSVSIAAGVAAITSAIAPLRGHEVALALGLLGLIVVANLRGVRESGRLFAPPTYLYIGMMSLLVGWGLIRVAFGDLGQLHVNHPALDHFTGGQTVLAGASSFLLLRAFSSGAVALSGVEAISNGIQAFRKPESRNAAITLTAVATILGTPVPRHRRARRASAPDVESRRDDPVDDGSRRVRHRSAVLAVAGVDRDDPHALGEHGVRRLPAPRGHRGDRRVPAAPAREPRRPPGALERHSRARARGRHRCSSRSAATSAR